MEYYSQMAEYLLLDEAQPLTEEERAWLKDKIARVPSFECSHCDPDTVRKCDGTYLGCEEGHTPPELEEYGGGLAVTSGDHEQAELERVADLVQGFFKKFRPDMPFSTIAVHYCSYPVPQEYGATILVVVGDRVRYIQAHEVESAAEFAACNPGSNLERILEKLKSSGLEVTGDLSHLTKEASEWFDDLILLGRR